MVFLTVVAIIFVVLVARRPFVIVAPIGWIYLFRSPSPSRSFVASLSSLLAMSKSGFELGLWIRLPFRCTVAQILETLTPDFPLPRAPPCTSPPGRVSPLFFAFILFIKFFLLFLLFLVALGFPIAIVRPFIVNFRRIWIVRLILPVLLSFLRLVNDFILAITFDLLEGRRVIFPVRTGLICAVRCCVSLTPIFMPSTLFPPPPSPAPALGRL
mmetsp:Transcript_13399/g.18547  ORF Transcript_13399/g.18547 Transcript_13399/m.18547 type:complete len:213 (-) Transcript_13399:311-949(-)